MPVSQKLNINFAAAYSQAEEAIENPEWAVPAEFYLNSGTDPQVIFGSTTVNNGALNGFYNNFAELNAALPTYSDLEYTQLNVSLGGTYNFSNNLYMMAKAQYEQFEDDQPYVYGDQDGTAISGNVGIGYNF